MTDTYETDIRTALAVMAHEVEVPEDLAGRTMAAVRDVRPDAPSRRRAWVYVAGTGAAAILLFVVGTFIAAHKSEPRLAQGRGAAKYAPSQSGGGQNTNNAISNGSGEGLPFDSGTSQAGDAVSGQVAGGPSTSNAGAKLVAGPAPVTPLNDLPKIVHTATVSVEVKDFEHAWQNANDLATRDGGFVTGSNTTESFGRVGSGSLTIRVPSDNLDRALHDLRALGVMTHLTTTGRDVSAPIADLNARKKNAEAEEAQLQNLLNNATDVSDVLGIRSRLNDTRNEIESIEGQLHGYQDQVDLATINATVFEKASAPGRPILGAGTLAHSVRTAGHLGLMLVGGLIILLGALVPLAAVAALGWFVLGTVRRRLQ